MNTIMAEIDLLKEMVETDILNDCYEVGNPYFSDEPNHNIFMKEIDYIELICFAKKSSYKAIAKALSIVEEFKKALNSARSTFICEDIVQYIKSRFKLA